MAGPLATLLASHSPVILDGAIGTLLEQRGVDTGLPLWSANALLTAPEALRRIHEEYIRAGADIVTTATFRTTGRTFRLAGLPDSSAELTAYAVGIAADARASLGARGVLIAGSMGPLEDCYRPDLVPGGAVLAQEHTEHARRLAEAGSDFLFLETFGTIRESLAAASAARGTGKEFVVSFLVTMKGTLYGGESVKDAVAAIAPLAPAALSVNCVSPRYVHLALDQLRTAAGAIPTGVYANVGLPGGEHGGTLRTDVDPEEYLSFARRWRAEGARIIGGCCGTSPDYIRLLADRLRKA